MTNLLTFSRNAAASTAEALKPAADEGDGLLETLTDLRRVAGRYDGYFRDAEAAGDEELQLFIEQCRSEDQVLIDRAQRLLDPGSALADFDDDDVSSTTRVRVRQTSRISGVQLRGGTQGSVLHVPERGSIAVPRHVHVLSRILCQALEACDAREQYLSAALTWGDGARSRFYCDGLEVARRRAERVYGLLAARVLVWEEDEGDDYDYYADEASGPTAR